MSVVGDSMKVGSENGDIVLANGLCIMQASRSVAMSLYLNQREMKIPLLY